MKVRIVVEYDPDTRHFTATIPGFPGIVVDAKSERTVLKLAREAVSFYLKEKPSSTSVAQISAPLAAKIVMVDV